MKIATPCVLRMGDVRHWHCWDRVEGRMLCSSNDAGANRAADVKTNLRKGIIMNVARTLNNWRKYRQTVTELGRMTNRELNDLGINRADIQSVARASVAF